MNSTRAGYGDALLELGAVNDKVVALDADLASSTYSCKFRDKYPERFVQCGVAEQNMMGVAAGLAVSGKICFTGSFAIFATERALEQVRNTICYNNLNVKLCPTHAGITVGEDGASHQAVEDLAIMRAIPGLKVFVPADYYEAKAAVLAAAEITGPVYVRLGRPNVPDLFAEDYLFKPGKAVKMREGRDLSICACGIMVSEALKAAEALAPEGIEAEIINISSLKPLDEAAIIESAKKTKRVLTAEEHSIKGGLGSAVTEVLAANYPVPVRMVGIADEFGRSGTVEDLLMHFGLTSDKIVEKAKELLTVNS